MSVGLLIITHDNIGVELLQTATQLLGQCPLPCKTISVGMDADIEFETAKAQQYCNELETGQGVLVLTDMFGSTPSNLANYIAASPAVHVVAGLNLPMLMRIFNYAALDLDELTEKAVSGGHDGVLRCVADRQSSGTA